MTRHPYAAYWNAGVDHVPLMTGATAVMDGADVLRICRGLGVPLPLTHVVDVGCGTGRLAQHVAGAYLGLDIAEDAIAYCRRQGVNAVLIGGAGDLAAVLDALAVVHLIACLSVFTHIGRPERLTYLEAFARCPARLLVDIIPGDGQGDVEHWTADPVGFVMDLEAAGYEVIGVMPQTSDTGVTHLYHAARPRHAGGVAPAEAA